MKKKIKKFSEKLTTTQRIVVAIMFPIIFGFILYPISIIFFDEILEFNNSEQLWAFCLIFIPIITYFEFHLFGEKGK